MRKVAIIDVADIIVEIQKITSLYIVNPPIRQEGRTKEHYENISEDQIISRAVEIQINRYAGLSLKSELERLGIRSNDAHKLAATIKRYVECKLHVNFGMLPIHVLENSIVSVSNGNLIMNLNCEGIE